MIDYEAAGSNRSAAISNPVSAGKAKKEEAVYCGGPSRDIYGRNPDIGLLSLEW